jgi:uncharacterized protein YggE
MSQQQCKSILIEFNTKNASNERTTSDKLAAEAQAKLLLKEIHSKAIRKSELNVNNLYEYEKKKKRRRSVYILHFKTLS